MSTDSAASYDSLEALRAAHLQFMQSYSEIISHSDRTDHGASDIRSFIARARTTGVILADPADRKAAQGILDYWSSELVNSPGVIASDFMPALLAPPDPRRAAQSADRPASADQKLDERSREIIRFAAAARLWRDSGKKNGYLLVGDAIAQAMKFYYLDPDIAELVDASEQARKRRRIFRWAALVLVVVGLYSSQFYLLPRLSKWSIEDIIKNPRRDVSTKQYTLWMLRWIQPWMPPFDLSGQKVQLENIDLTGIRYYSINFSKASFANVNFSQADLRNASFSESHIFKGSRFNNTDLSLAQFSDATIEATSFAGAELYRTIFDRACLVDVAFTGADLRSTSFWGTGFDAASTRQFANTAW
jgi:hypothetical protein